MKAEHINPFLTAVSNTFSTMLMCEARRGDMSLADPTKPKFPISGVIGLSGKAAGTVVINLSEEVAVKGASAMLMMEMTEMNEDVCRRRGRDRQHDRRAGESELEEYDLSVSLPNVITGQGHEIRFPSDAKPIAVAFDTDFGPLQLVVGLEEVCEPAAV